MTLVATSPCLKRISVGIESTSNFAAVSWLSSTLSLTIFSASPRSPAICSRIGATMRHGPHQGAQKSTRTGVSASRTSAWKFESVTSETAAIRASGSFGRDGVRPRFTKYSEGSDPVRLPAPGLTPCGLPHEGREDPGGDPGLDGRGGQDDRHRDGDGHERGGQQLVPSAPAAGHRPGGEREE